MDDVAQFVEVSGETVAARLIRLLGVKKIAEACAISTWAVYRWPSTEGIPTKHQRALYYLAKREGVRLTAEQIIGVE